MEIIYYGKALSVGAAVTEEAVTYIIFWGFRSWGVTAGDGLVLVWLIRSRWFLLRSQHHDERVGGFIFLENLPGSTLEGKSGRADSVVGEAIIDNLDTYVLTPVLMVAESEVSSHFFGPQHDM